mmetsp:Transcript_29090/g.55967  ORF Transcript_29090/g.55967 Transcript_29090/m.55967 type:complete len:186 (+) Transcript_29090:2373-2930(+)
MSQRIAIVTGISGVGKSWLLKRVGEHIPIQVLSAGRVIRDQIARDLGQEVSYDDLRTRDVAANQEALKVGFQNACDPHTQIVVLDAHVVIDTPNGLKSIETAVFDDIGASLIIFLEQKPGQIAENRSRDSSRKRPLRDSETLDRHQKMAKLIAEQVATDLGISYHVLQSDDIEGLIWVLSAKAGF